MSQTSTYFDVLIGRSTWETKRAAFETLIKLGQSDASLARSFALDLIHNAANAIEHWEENRHKHYAIFWWSRRVLAHLCTCAPTSGVRELLLSHLHWRDPCDCFVIEVLKLVRRDNLWFLPTLKLYAQSLTLIEEERDIVPRAQCITSVLSLIASLPVPVNAEMLSEFSSVKVECEKLFDSPGHIVLPASECSSMFDRIAEFIKLDVEERLMRLVATLTFVSIDVNDSYEERFLLELSEELSQLSRVDPESAEAVLTELVLLTAADRPEHSKVAGIHGLLELIALDTSSEDVGSLAQKAFDELNLAVLRVRGESVIECVSLALGILS